MSNFTLSILGGKYRGKKLYSAPKESTRSTKAILKGSLFDTIQFEIVDQIFIEVFGGSGSVGLEALSRGASFAYFIERDEKAYRVLAKNCELIDKSSVELYLADSFEVFPKIIDKISKDKKRVFIYFDPPFDIRDGMSDIYDRVFSMVENIPKDTLCSIIIEHSSRLKLPDMIGSFYLKKSRRFGKSSLSYFMA